MLVLVLLLGTAAGTLAADEPLEIVRDPYVQALTWDSVAIHWEVSYAGDCELQYGKDPGDLRWVRVSRDSVCTHVLSGLEENTIYSFRVRTADDISGLRSFTTPPRERGDFTFAVYGDSRSGHEAHAQVVAAMEERDPAFVLHTGDLVNDGTSKEEWMTFLDVTGPLNVDTPIWPAMGNHDLPEMRPGGPFWYREYLMDYRFFHTHYSFEWRGALFISLDSTRDLTVGSDQYLWLEEALATSNATWTFVQFHHPPYSSGRHGSYLDLRRDLDPLFQAEGVTAVFNGHDHCYEHSLPPSGVHYFVTGGGGGPLYEVAGSNVTVASASEYHFLLVDVQRDGVLVEAIDTGGKVIDRTVIGDYDDGAGTVDGQDDLGLDLPLVVASVVIVLVVALGVALCMRRPEGP